MILDRVDNDCFCIYNLFKYILLLRKELKYSTKNEECYFFCFLFFLFVISVNSQNFVDVYDNNNFWNRVFVFVERNFIYSQCLQRFKVKLLRDLKNFDLKCVINCVIFKLYVFKIFNDNRISKMWI